MGALKVGVAVVDITPEPGLVQSGFAARTEPAIGVHDPLTARAVVVGETAIVVADVIGFHEDMSARIRGRCSLPGVNIIVAATHTHGAPNSMAGRISGADRGFQQRVEDGCVEALENALKTARPATLAAGYGQDPDVARNRRHAGGPLDRSLPVIRARDAEGKLIATIVSYACHPTVLGADNRLMTADYPYYVRQKIEAANPGSVALFLNGCAGDVNIGHTAQASWTLDANNTRTFANAERLGVRIADAALAAPEVRIGGGASAVDAQVDLALERREPDLPSLTEVWELEAETAEPLRKVLLRHWVNWSRTHGNKPPGSWSGRVSVLNWGGVRIVGLPGEIFAETALTIRAVLADGPALVLSYADSTPGYIPPAGEYRHGGYEVDEAHRFIGMPGAFVSGSAERLVDTAKRLLAMLKQ